MNRRAMLSSVCAALGSLLVPWRAKASQDNTIDWQAIGERAKVTFDATLENHLGRIPRCETEKDFRASGKHKEFMTAAQPGQEWSEWYQCHLWKPTGPFIRWCGWLNDHDCHWISHRSTLTWHEWESERIGKSLAAVLVHQAYVLQSAGIYDMAYLYNWDLCCCQRPGKPGDEELCSISFRGAIVPREYAESVCG